MKTTHHTKEEEMESGELTALFNDAKESITPDPVFAQRILDAIPEVPYTPSIKSPYSIVSDRFFQLAARTPWKISVPIAIVFLMLVSIGAGGKREDPLALNTSLGMQKSAVIPTTLSSAEDVPLISPAENTLMKRTVMTAPIAEPSLLHADEATTSAREAGARFRVNSKESSEGSTSPKQKDADVAGDTHASSTKRKADGKLLRFIHGRDRALRDAVTQFRKTFESREGGTKSDLHDK